MAYSYTYHRRGAFPDPYIRKNCAAQHTFPFHSLFLCSVLRAILIRSSLDGALPCTTTASSPTPLLHHHTYTRAAHTAPLLHTRAWAVYYTPHARTLHLRRTAPLPRTAPHLPSRASPQKLHCFMPRAPAHLTCDLTAVVDCPFHEHGRYRYNTFYEPRDYRATRTLLTLRAWLHFDLLPVACTDVRFTTDGHEVRRPSFYHSCLAFVTGIIVPSATCQPQLPTEPAAQIPITCWYVFAAGM